MTSKQFDCRPVAADVPPSGVPHSMSEDELRREADAIIAQARAEAEAKGNKKLIAALAVIGSWSDLDGEETWEESVAALDRIRHESVPTPPIDDLP